jgi:RNA polymerase sigma-70 factor, ECF subfamily
MNAAMMPTIPYPSTSSLSDSTWPNRSNGCSAAQDDRIRLAKNGDLDAFNELVLIYQDCVYRQALWILNDEFAAEDAAQDAFLQAYRKLHTFHGGPFRPWLLKITTNCCIDQIRAAKRRPSQPFTTLKDDDEEIEPYWVRDLSDTPEQSLERAETGDAILHALQKLAPEYRIAIILVDLQELDYAQAAGILRIPLGTFKSRLARGREKLRLELLGLMKGGLNT